jgi:GAF domain-containing protein
LDPIPETERAMGELEHVTGEAGLLDALIDRADRARDLVPDLLGVSVARLQEGLTFTLVASDEDIAVLDALQYVGGGPCVEGARTGEVQATWLPGSPGPLNEETWRMFAYGSAARGVRSTLTLPILDPTGTSVGSVNLYAGSARAFDDVHSQLAMLFGAWAAGAVANADLSFATRLEAVAAPGRLRDRATIAEAVDIIAREQGIERESAEQRLRTAAAQAGLDLVQLARDVIGLDDDRDGDA